MEEDFRAELDSVRSVGMYYVRARVSGKLFYASLKTTTFSVAKLRLEDKVEERRTLAVTAEQRHG